MGRKENRMIQRYRMWRANRQRFTRKMLGDRLAAWARMMGQNVSTADSAKTAWIGITGAASFLEAMLNLPPASLMGDLLQIYMEATAGRIPRGTRREIMHTARNVIDSIQREKLEKWLDEKDGSDGGNDGETDHTPTD